jgi:ribosomal protein L37AE/L43A
MKKYRLIKTLISKGNLQNTKRFNHECWKCSNQNLEQKFRETFFCNSCKIIQKPNEKYSYFHVLNQ